MSVATQLGLHDPDTDLLAAARARWPRWGRQHPCLRVREDLLEVPAWTRAAPAGHVDPVLLVLAELSAVDGGDDPAATGALAWLLLPGASGLAANLARVSHRIDEVVAAQLWIEARTFNWRDGHKVAANILMNTRKAVLRDLGITFTAADRAWSTTAPVENIAEVIPLRPPQQTPGEAAAAHRVHALLADATTGGLLTGPEGRFLLDLATAAGHHECGRDRRGYAGLLGDTTCDTVASRWGVSRSTVVRRAKRNLTALRLVHCARPVSAGDSQRGGGRLQGA